LPVLVDLYCPGWRRNLAHIGRSGVDFNNYAEAMADKRWSGDADIEAQARRNLELLGGLGGGEES
jgi:hypothetical protein